MKILSMTNHRHSIPAILRNSEKRNAVHLQWQKLFLCVTGPYWHIKSNVNDLQYLPMTLAFIKAVKTMRMSGRPSPFTSHSSSGDNTPPATITESHYISKRPPSSFFTLGEEGWPRNETSLTKSAKEPPRAGSSHHGKIFHCMERKKCSIWIRERKNGGANRKRLMFPTSIFEVMWSHISYKKLRFGSRGRKQGGRDISRPGRNYFTKPCYFIAEARVGDTLEMLPVTHTE